MVTRYPFSSGISHKETVGSPKFPSYPVDTCPALRPRRYPGHSPYRIQDCCLPHNAKRRLSLPRLPGELIQMTTTIHISGLGDAACILDPSGFGLPLQGLPSDFTTYLLVKLLSVRVELRRATTLGFGGSSTKFPSRPQSDSHNPRFHKAPFPSRTIGFPESGCRP